MTAVAIDGPAGSGKSTVARAVARALGFTYLDTGALYRALSLAALERGVPPHAEEALAELASTLDISSEGEAITLDGVDVGDRIRDADVTEIVSTVSAHPRVRAALLDRQRGLARNGDVVMEGRDIGTTVLPHAEVKVFLTADAHERALRRAVQEGRPTDEAGLAALRAEIEARDEADATRDASPPARPPGALLLDTTGMSIDEVVSAIVAEVRRR